MKKAILSGIILITLILVLTFFINYKKNFKKTISYASSSVTKTQLYDLNFKKIKEITRGSKVTILKKTSEYSKILYDNNEYYIKNNNLIDDMKKVVLEREMYVRTPVTIICENKLSYAKKGSKLDVIDYDKLNKDGTVNKYKVQYNGDIGYVYAKYLTFDYDSAVIHYDHLKTYKIHEKRKNTLGGGSAANLDFYPFKKDKIINNDMPKETRALYLNSGVIGNIDKYIKFAKENNINSFVVDIKDNTAPAYKSEIMKKYSKTNYEHAFHSMEGYKKQIKKLKDNGFYVIGRITVFKDSYYVNDHKASAILDSKTNEPFKHNGSYWPSAYNREVWLFNVELAKEAVKEMGFNEIQFDYIRFPDRTLGLERENKINFNNKYDEDKASAIQSFLIYAFDELREVNAYISADVFGESAHNYVTGYGQYWGAISNVVDVISPMPYPDHFGKYEYGFNVPVWTIPYDVLSVWANNFVVKRQNEIPTPAIVRTWLQTYNAIKSPNIVYDDKMVYGQIKALRDANLNGGYMTWNAGSSLSKYEFVKEAFKKEK